MLKTVENTLFLVFRFLGNLLQRDTALDLVEQRVTKDWNEDLLQ